VHDERRDGQRFHVWFPVQFEAGTRRGRIAVSHDVSARGILLSAATDLEPGAEVSITFRVLPDDPEDRTVRGRVVRVEPNADDPDGLWPLRVAVEFDQPEPDLERQLADAEAFKRSFQK
jgi:hypothetical protein